MTEPIDEKLSRVTFIKDEQPHIRLDAGICSRCTLDRICLEVCPAGNFKHDQRSGQVAVSTESCMECGACRIACTDGAVDWHWPRGGFGVCYTRS